MVNLSQTCLRALTLSAALAAGGSAQAAMLFHHYDFSTGVIDLVGTANGTLIDNAHVAGGQLVLDGNGDYVQFANHLIPIAGSYSVALFGQRNLDQGTFTEMISQGYSGGPGHYIGTDQGGNIRAGDQWVATGVPFGPVGSLTHYALVVDASGGGSTRLFVNGLNVASLPFAIVSTPLGSDTRLGAQFAPYGEFFNGVIDDVRIYDGALTPLEVAQLATPVPEPGTWAMLSLGLALSGIVLRSRRPT